MKRSEAVAWAAGFFDGEGCIVVKNAKRQGERTALARGIGLSVQQNEPRPLRRLQTLFGGSVLGPYTRTRSRAPGVISNPYWVWRLNGTSAQDALRQMRPYLTVKAAKADEVC